MLLVDCHEPATIIEKLSQAIPTKRLRLKYGDYSFSNIVIERKTLSDFFSSLKEDRLEEQIENISRYYLEAYLLVCRKFLLLIKIAKISEHAQKFHYVFVNWNF